MKFRFAAVGGTLTLALALVGQPASAQVFTPPCFVSDGGRIATVTTSTGTFGGSAVTDGTLVGSGQQVYVDHDPVTGFQFRSLSMTAIMCDPDARRAVMHGTGEVTTDDGPRQLVAYRIEVADYTDGRLADEYQITLSNGYDSGRRPVLQGNVQVMGR
jgi:hypothetical protein